MPQIPSKATLRKYGLTAEEWRQKWALQGGKCAICKCETKRLCIDHYHAKGWAKLPPEKRRLYVRGLLCWVCNNRVLTRGITEGRLRAAADYLYLYRRDMVWYNVS